MGAHEMRDPVSDPERATESDEAILHRLGYAHVLYREMGGSPTSPSRSRSSRSWPAA